MKHPYHKHALQYEAMIESLADIKEYHAVGELYYDMKKVKATEKLRAIPNHYSE